MRKYSIQQYVVWLTLIPLLIMVIGLEAYFLHDRSSDLDRDLMERGKLIAHQIASSSEYGVFSDNRPFLQNIAQSVLQEPDVRGIVIQNSIAESLIEAGDFSETTKRKIAEANVAKFAHSGVAATPQVDKFRYLVDSRTPLVSDGNSLWIYQPIVPVQVSLDDFGNQPAARHVGAVIVELSWARTEKLKSQMLWLTIGVTTLFLMLTMIMLYRASRRITLPICELSDAVLMIGKGHLETRIPGTTHVTELSTLVHGINEMAAQLQQENAILHQRAEEATRLAAIAFESQEGMIVTDLNGVIVRVNSAFSRITGYTDKEAVGQNPRILKSGHHDADFYKAMWESIRNTGAWHGEIWNRHKSGEMFPALATITQVKLEDGKSTFYVATYTDITLRKAAETEIRNLAFNDPLTQLPNRRTLIERLTQTMIASKRSGRYGALMFIDLDNFKPLNDQHGHEAGDSLLIEAAHRLTSCVREVDTVARFGGDEFVVMLSDLDAEQASSCAQARAVAEKVRAALAQPYILPIRNDGHIVDTLEHQCTSSIGVQLFVGHEASVDDVLKQADDAMYLAKKNGRNSVCLGNGSGAVQVADNRETFE